jgi:opacity protein-like surface antigen
MSFTRRNPAILGERREYAHSTSIALSLSAVQPLFVAEEDTTFRKGELQPYASLAPVIFITGAKPAGLESDTDTSLGLKVGAGATFLITNNLGILGEYRFTHVSPEFKFTTAGTVSKPEFDVNTHHLIVGASFRF